MRDPNWPTVGEVLQILGALVILAVGTVVTLVVAADTIMALTGR